MRLLEVVGWALPSFALAAFCCTLQAAHASCPTILSVGVEEEEVRIPAHVSLVIFCVIWLLFLFAFAFGWVETISRWSGEGSGLSSCFLLHFLMEQVYKIMAMQHVLGSLFVLFALPACNLPSSLWGG